MEVLNNQVESFDPVTDSWQAEASLKTARNWQIVWVASGEIYVGGVVVVQHRF